VGEDVAIEWMRRGIVDVGDEHAFAQVIEHDDARPTTRRRDAFSCNSAQSWSGRSASERPCGCARASARTIACDGTVRRNWWTEHASDLSVSSRSTPRQTRWSPHPHWPFLPAVAVPTLPGTHSNPGRFQVGTGSLPAHPGFLLDAPQWASESSQGYNLLFFLFAQDVAHTDEGYCLASESTSRSLILVGRFWVTAEGQSVSEERHHPLILIGIFIVVLLAIHPFKDGNGRLSRIITTLLLLRAGTQRR